jgi:hypothetical protein
MPFMTGYHSAENRLQLLKNKLGDNTIITQARSRDFHSEKELTVSLVIHRTIESTAKYYNQHKLCGEEICFQVL